jgi:hypothetical protein
MIDSNTQGNDYTCEIELCLGACLVGCMRNDSNRLIISIRTTTFKFITCRHTVMHSYLTTAKTENIII